MGNEIPLQLAQFLRSILLGNSIALLYEIARALRRYGGSFRRGALDMLMGFSATAAVFLFIMAEEGELRLFMLLGILGGAVFFFSVFSAVLRPILTFWTDLLLVPLRLGNIFLKKVREIFKKVFSFFKKRFTIMGNLAVLSTGEEADEWHPEREK